jgi:hypothetical protein
VIAQIKQALELGTLTLDSHLLAEKILGIEIARRVLCRLNGSGASQTVVSWLCPEREYTEPESFLRRGRHACLDQKNGRKYYDWR